MRNHTFLDRPIYSALTKIYHHYNRDANAPERHTKTQKEEQGDFLDKLVQSPVIQMLHRVFICRGMLPARFTGIVVPWQKLGDCFLKVTAPVTHNGISVITVISHFTQPTRDCCGRS